MDDRPEVDDRRGGPGTDSPRGFGPDSGSRATRRIHDRLPSLLHELIDYGVVERDTSGRWQLSGEVQTLLEEQSVLHAVSGRRVFVGLRCEGCGTSTVTWLVGERRLCAACAQPQRGEDVAAGPQVTRSKGRRKLGAHPFRRAG